MRGSVQAAGRKPAPNNRGKWRNWKKTQWQQSQHRWFSAERHDSWEKALGAPQTARRSARGLRQPTSWGWGSPAEWDLVLRVSPGTCPPLSRAVGAGSGA